MTITGLWPFLRQHGFVREVHGAEARDLLQGKRIAIDVAFWAVQGDVVECTTTRCQHFLLTSFWRVCRYLRVGALPFAVLDSPSGASWKRRQRCPDGQFLHDIHMIKDLFSALGCPTLQAGGEAEACCSNMTTMGMADAIDSGDGDVFAFGATGLLLKSVGGDGRGAWSLEVVSMDQVSAALGVSQQGWIAAAALSGCDFLPRGAGGIGIAKGLQCARAMLKHCGEEVSLCEFMLAALEGGLPDELRAYASLSGCKTSMWACYVGSRCYCYIAGPECICVAFRIQDVDAGLLCDFAVLVLNSRSVIMSVCLFVFFSHAVGWIGASDVGMDLLGSCRMAALDAFSVVPRAAWVDLAVASCGFLDRALACFIAITMPWFWPGPFHLRKFSLQLQPCGGYGLRTMET